MLYETEPSGDRMTGVVYGSRKTEQERWSRGIINEIHVDYAI